MKDTIKVYAPEHLRPNNVCDLVKCHISDRNVPQDHGTVEDTGDWWKGGGNFMMYGPEGLLVCYIAARTGTSSEKFHT